MSRGIVTEHDYESETAKQFCREVTAAGFKPYHYNGRWFWEGPAINVDELQDGYRATSVKCQQDNMGLGWVIYPRSSAANKGE